MKRWLLLLFLSSGIALGSGVTPPPTRIGGKVQGVTTGSVLFGATGSTLGQSNATFFYDVANGRLGIGTATPTNQIQIVNAAASGTVMVMQSSVATTGNMITIQRNGGGTGRGILIQNSGTTTGNSLEIQNLNATSTIKGIQVTQSGLGTGIAASQTNAASGGAAILGTTVGSGHAIYGEVSGTGSGTGVVAVKTSASGKALGVVSGATASYVAINAQHTPAFTSWELTLPNSDGNSGECFKTDGSGITSWGNCTTGDNIDLPTTTASVGQVRINGTRFLHGYGSSNAFVGESSGNFTATGVQNVGVGRLTLQALTSGNSNTAVGDAAGYSQISGNGSTYVGRGAGFATNGSNVTLIGNQAGDTANIGADSTVIGFEALRNATGAANTVIGSGSGSTVTTGVGNVLIGYLSNVGSGAVSRAAAIGYQAVASQDDAIILGNAANAGVKVGIGTASPSDKLTVSGGFIKTDSGTGLTNPGSLNINASTNVTFATNATGNRLSIDVNGKVGVATGTPTELFDVNSDAIRIRTPRTIATSTTTCDQGEISWDADYIYVCIAPNTWARTLLDDTAW